MFADVEAQALEAARTELEGAGAQLLSRGADLKSAWIRGCTKAGLYRNRIGFPVPRRFPRALSTMRCWRWDRGRMRLP